MMHIYDKNYYIKVPHREHVRENMKHTIFLFHLCALSLNYSFTQNNILLCQMVHHNKRIYFLVRQERRIPL